MITGGPGKSFGMQIVDRAGWARAIAASDIDHPVVDLSGIQGAWDFSVTFSASSQASSPAPGDAGVLAAPDGRISIFDAFKKQLRLELAPQTRPIAVLVVDSARPVSVQ